MALDDKSILNNKLSPLIEGQVPDFIQSDHPVFVNFLKDYYKFLEAGQLTISTTTDYVALETSSSSYIINEVDSDRIVTELGAGTKGFFEVGEIITGETSKATAEVLVDDSRNARIFITSQQKFITGETITGGTSSSTGIVLEYRGNPVQNIQQMLNYADVDNTIYDFLDKMRDSFMIDIPNDLASGVSSRNLIKNIKDLYAAKGTSEGHKLFMKILLGESADIFYPNQYMMKPSAATFESVTTLRVLSFSGSSGEEVVNQLITGQTSDATAIVVSSITSQQTKTVGSTDFNDSVTELEVSNINGTFLEDEVIIGVSTRTDQESKFTVKGIVSSATVVNDGILYTDGETIDVEVVGNGIAELVVDGIKSGSVIGFHIENNGTGYSVGDPLVFTSAAADTDIDKARGEVVMVGGGIQLESGTLDDSTLTDDTLILEDGSILSFVPFNFQLEQVLEDTLIADGTTKIYTLTNVNATNDNISVFINGDKIVDNFTNSPNSGFRINELGLVELFNENSTNINWVASGTTITFTNAPAAESTIKIFGGFLDSLILDRTDLTGASGTFPNDEGGTNSGHKLESNSANLELDRYSSSRDGFILEEETFVNLGVSSEAGEIRRAAITENGGYTELPTITVTSLSGTGAKILGLTKTIGAVNDVKIQNSGFRYTNTNPPELTFRAHFILKDVTGTFAKDNTLTTHNGTVVNWDSTRNILTTTFENVERITQEQTGTFNEGIQLEQATEILTPSGTILEDEQAADGSGFINNRNVFVEEDRIVFDATEVIDPYDETPQARFEQAWCGTGVIDNLSAPVVKKEKISVTAKYDINEKTWAFYFGGEKQRELILYEGTEYYFDLSDASLYGEKTGLAGFLQKNFAISTTPDGTHAGGSADTNFVTSSLSSIRIGARTSPIASRYIEDYQNTFEDSRSPGKLEVVTSKATGIKSFVSVKYTAEEEAIYRSEQASLLQYKPFGYVPRNWQLRLDELEPTGGYTPDELEANLRGYVGAYLRINIPKGAARAGNYYYYSPNFSGMGGVFQVRTRPKIIKGEGDVLTLERESVQETAFLLETGSQDRNVGHTDKLLMEDSFVDFFGTVAQSASVTNFLGVVDSTRLNLLNQGYEPTFFMNEDYRPIKQYENLFTFEERDSGIFNQAIQQPDSSLLENAKIVHPDSDAEDNFFPLFFTGCVQVAMFPKDIDKETFRNYLVLDSVRENLQGFIVLDGTDADGSDAGSLVANEDFGNTLRLERTDLVGASGTFPNDEGGSDARDGFLLDDETGAGTITLNASDSSSTDTGDDIILESEIDFSNSDVTITDSGGASGKIIFNGADIATATTAVATTSASTGSYRGINNLLGEDLIRIQDSYYYQDYSYEVRVGQSLVTYFDELKKAVHPAGFQPFGKVSIATLVSAAITNTGAGVSDYTGATTTFSPELGSVLETIFSQVLQSRLQVPSTVTADGTVPIGSRDDRIVQETGVLPGENLVLDASAASTDVGSNLIFEDENLELELGSGNIVLNGTDITGSLNAGENIRINLGTGFDLEDGLTTAGDGAFFYEVSTITSGDDNTSGSGLGGGQIMAETSHALSGNSDRSLVTQRVTKIESRPLPKFERNILLYLAQTPFGDEPCGITLEAGSGNLTDNIIMDGEIPFAEGNAFMELERDSKIDNIILDGTDPSGANAGEGLVLESGFFLKIEDPSLGRESETFTILFENDGKLQLEASIVAFPIGFHVSEGNKLLFDTLDNDETITLSDISSLTFQDIRTVDKIEIQGLIPDEENWGGGADDDNITMEDFGQILLDQTDSDGSNAGFHLLQETSKRNRFTLEESGNLIVETFSTLSNFSAITLEEFTESEISGNLLLEVSGQNSLSEGLLSEFKIVHEGHNIFTSRGQIPAENYRLNSTSIITKGNVRSAEVSVRDTGDIALEDATNGTAYVGADPTNDNTHGFLVINSTSGSSTNAGENLDLEGATGITY